MKSLHWLTVLLLAPSPALAQAGGLDSDNEIVAPIRDGEKAVIPLDTSDPT